MLQPGEEFEIPLGWIKDFCLQASGWIPSPEAWTDVQKAAPASYFPSVGLGYVVPYLFLQVAAQTHVFQITNYKVKLSPGTFFSYSFSFLPS